ncbi:hypothetical protein ASE78_06910 [Sphingomonas sp. Leaf25]|nr:hypothetical protein ASE78_06910 [Sphingomonas sp. Leaf25]
MWGVAPTFSAVKGRSDPSASITCTFQGEMFKAEIVPHREARQFRLFLQEELRAALARTFLMSYMRELDTKLAGSASGGAARRRVEDAERAFWEFADLEFDTSNRTMRIVAHYVQKPDFPHLFARLAGSAPMRRIDDELGGKIRPRIHKQPWRPRDQYLMEIGARNVVYMLADCANHLIYVGEADDMVARFRRGHGPIPDWTHYRYDLLPPELATIRVTIERQLICDVDAILGGWAVGLPTHPGTFRMVNTKIDR